MSLLRKVGIYNNFPAHLLPQLPKAGTVVVFQFINIFINNLTREKRFPNVHPFPTTSSFKDPETGEIYQIGLIERVSKSGDDVERFLKVRAEPQRTGGTYSIVIGSSPQANDIYRYFMLASFVENNPNRVESEEAQVILLDAAKDAQVKIDARQSKYAAVDFARAIEESDLEDVCLVLGIDPTLSIPERRDLVEEYAEKNPTDFLTKVKDGDSVYVALINNAMRLQVVLVAGTSLVFKAGNTKILELSGPEHNLVPGEFTRFVKTEKQGPAIVSKLRDLIGLEAKKQNKKGPAPSFAKAPVVDNNPAETPEEIEEREALKERQDKPDAKSAEKTKAAKGGKSGENADDKF